MSGWLAVALCGSLLTQAPDSNLTLVARWLPGTYDTFAQAAADDSSGAAYRHVRAVLRVMPVAIEGLPDDARAFYLEQALAGQEAAPYRQRLIVLRTRDGVLMNELYRVTNAAALVGFDGRRALAMSAMEREPGCDAVWQRASAGAFTGAAGVAARCPSTLRGATHAVTHFALTSGTFTTLDQGVDDAGVVHWGPPNGVVGHVFVKRP